MRDLATAHLQPAQLRDKGRGGKRIEADVSLISIWAVAARPRARGFKAGCVKAVTVDTRSIQPSWPLRVNQKS
jgi:hypothetical protein